MNDCKSDYDGRFIQYSERFQKAFTFTNRKLGTVIEQQLKGHLTGPQCYILNIVSEASRTTSSMLAEQLQVKPSAITVMVDRLVQNKYIVRLPDPQDRRVTLLQLTEKGAQAIEEVRTSYRAALAQLIEELNKEEQETFIQLFERIADAASKLE